jgi:hypothetical protein
MRTASIIGILGLLALGGAACGGGAMAHVQERAAFDLKCSENQITVQEGSGCNYYATGCGKRAAYVVRAEAADSMVCCPPAGCTAILNSDITTN